MSVSTKVYALQYTRWDDHYLLGIFTTRELAEKYMVDIIKSGGIGENPSNYYITEEELIGK